MKFQSGESIGKIDIVELLNEALNYLDRIILSKGILLKAIDDKEYQKLYSNFQELFEGLTWLNKLLNDLFNIVSLDYKNLLVGSEEKTVQNIIQDFNNFLQELEACIQNKDYILLNDLLEYEFTEQIGEYKQIFIELEIYFKNIIN